jgi:hypothetical protein
VILDILSLQYEAIAAFYSPTTTLTDIEPYIDPLSVEIPPTVNAYINTHPSIQEEPI